MLIGFSVFGAAYAIGHQYRQQTEIRGRIRNINAPAAAPAGGRPKPDVSFPAQQLRKSLTSSDANQDKLTRDLFMAGFRSKASVQKMQKTLRLVMLIPLGTLVLLYSTGALTQKALFFVLVGGSIMYYGVRFNIDGRVKKRRARIERELPMFLDLLVISVESGLSFTSAIPLIIRELGLRGPLTQEFNTMYHEYAGGLSIGEACNRLAGRCGVPALSVILGNIVQSEKIGTSLADTLRIMATETRDKYRQAMREKAMKVPAKILLPSLLIFLAILILIIVPPLCDMAGYFSSGKM